MTTTGTVRTWFDEQGWGVLDSAETPGGCWTHFSAVDVPGYRSLSAGQSVTFDWEQARQDGYAYRAVRAWPADRPPAGTLGMPQPSDAYASQITIWEGPAGGAWRQAVRTGTVRLTAALRAAAGGRSRRGRRRRSGP